jgi:hypothetical protein
MSLTAIYILGPILALALLVALSFALAPMLAVRRRVKKVRILGGIGEYIVWDPKEVLIMRRGGTMSISGEQGGAQFIYPLFGEEVRGRVSLGLQSLTWKDTVNIQETIPCNIEVVVWWDVQNVSDYFFRDNLVRHPHESEELAARNTAEADLKKLIGARVRKIASQADFQISFVEMLLLNESEYRAVRQDRAAASASPSGAANISANLERALQEQIRPEELTREAQASGLRVARVEVQSINWATEVQKPVLETWLARLKPEQARSRAEAERIIEDSRADSYAHRLSKISDVLGQPVTQMRELLQNLPDVSSNTQDELAKAIITEFKNQNAKTALPAKEDEKTAPPKIEAGTEPRDD